MKPFLLLLLTCLFIPCLLAADKVLWNEKNYPDPTKDGFEQCGMTSKSLVCDVDRMLNESQRINLNSQLIEFENATFHPDGETPCKRKGTTLAVAIVDNISEEMQKQEKLSYLAVFLHAKWTLDEECKKSFIILLPTKNWRFISRDFHYEAPVFFDEFSYIFFREQELFKNGSYFDALSNIVQGLKNAIVAKTKELGEDSMPSQPALLDLADWELRQNQSLLRLEQMIEDLASRHQQQEAKDGEDRLITTFSYLLNNTSTEQNLTLDQSQNLATAIVESSQQHKCSEVALSTTHYLFILALICVCYVVLGVLGRVCDCLWMIFKTRKSYNVGIKEQRSGVSFQRQECALSTTKLTNEDRV